MIVYVETNFVLELAFLQEEHESCEEVMRLSEAEKITLVIPAFSIAEARTGLLHKEKQRSEFRDRPKRELRELSRSKPHAEIHAQTEPLTNALVASSQREKEELESITSRILRIGQVVPLESSTVEDAIRNETTLGLKPPDATVYASIIANLRGRRGSKCFLNKNSKDFANPVIRDELKKHNCKMFPSFANGFGYISKQLSKQR